MKESITFIVNPFSGTTNKYDFDKIVKDQIDTNRYEYTIKYTESAGHATTLALEAASQQKSIVVAVGGDGTINEVAAGLVHTEVALAILPAGSGNGFALHLGMNKDHKSAIQQLNTAKRSKVDTCLLNGKFFINVAGKGFDAQVAYHTKTDSKRGFWNYLKRTIQLSAKYRPEELSLEIDGKKIEGKYAAAVVANASKYGYIFTVAPFAKLNDGLLDIILFKDTFVPRYFMEAYRFVNNTVHKSSITETYTGKFIKIKSVNKSYYHLDGEGFDKTTDFEISVVPDSIWVMQI